METVLSMINRLGGGLLFLVLGAFSVLGTSAAAQAERYVPTIWVDPDGCEHWVMDDGAEGYIALILHRRDYRCVAKVQHAAP